MQKHRNVLLRAINRIFYFGAAGMMAAALVLGLAFQPALAHFSPTNTPTTVTGYGQLQISDIQCSNNQVAIQFILNNVPQYWTPDTTITFTLKINGGSPTTQTATFSSQTGGAYHYFYYGTVNGTYDVTAGHTFVRWYSYSHEVDLHNPDAYGSTNQSCAATATATKTATKTPTATWAPTHTFTPTATSTSLPTFTYTPTFTATSVPSDTPTATATSVPPTDTPTDTMVPTDQPTDTPTDVPPTFTPIPTDQPTPTDTPVTPTEVTPTDVTPTDVTPTDVTPTDVTPTDVTPTDTTPTDVTPGTTPENTTTPPPPVVHVLQPLSISVDPFCTVDSQMQWTIENPNSSNFVYTSFTVDGSSHGGGSAAPGSTKLVTTALGTHTVKILYGDGQSVSLTDTLTVCPLPIPNTGGGLLIPVTGANQAQSLSQGLFFSGLAFAGLGLILSALRKFLNL